MHDHVTQVDQYPFAGCLAFDTQNGAAVFFDFVAYRGGQRLGLAVRGAGCNRDPIEQAGQMDCVEHFDVLCLDVFECIDDQRLQCFDIHLILIKMVLLNVV